MNILFATLVDVNSLDEQGIYQDLMREIAALGHDVYIISPAERRQNKPTAFFQSETGGILKVRIGNIQKTGKIEKGISTLLLESQYVRAVRRYFSSIRFDLIMYSTPPITLGKLVEFIKNRDGAKSYLLLKDIFPQNAVDLDLILGSGVVYNFFRNKEKKLYWSSDYIGCMSPANMAYLLEHNPQIDKGKVHISPNSISPKSVGDGAKRGVVREKYGIAADKKVLIYGGNLGKPQCVSFIIECLKLNYNKEDRYFLICGEGTDAKALIEYISEERPSNVKHVQLLPKETYDELVSACDVGLIFLDHRFTIPNFPSRLLSYMEQAIPVLACTDTSTDIGAAIDEGRFGWHCESNDPSDFTIIVDDICKTNNKVLKEKGLQGRKYLEENYNAVTVAKSIVDIVDSKATD